MVKSKKKRESSTTKSKLFPKLGILFVFLILAIVVIWLGFSYKFTAVGHAASNPCSNFDHDGWCPAHQQCLRNSAGVYACQLPYAEQAEDAASAAADPCSYCISKSNTVCGIPVASVGSCSQCPDQGNLGSLCLAGMVCQFSYTYSGMPNAKAVGGVCNTLSGANLYKNSNGQSNQLPGTVSGDLFVGYSATELRTITDISDLRHHKYALDNALSSIQLIAGNKLSAVTIYADPYFSGKSMTLWATRQYQNPSSDAALYTGGIKDLQHYDLNTNAFSTASPSENWNDKISSIRFCVDFVVDQFGNHISCDTDVNNNGIFDGHEQGVATLYQQQDFGNVGSRLLDLNPEANYETLEIAQDSADLFPNLEWTGANILGSIIVRGENSVVLYSENNYQGQATLVYGKKADSSSLRASSLKVCKGAGCKTDLDNDQIPDKLDSTPCPSGQHIDNGICCNSGYSNSGGMCVAAQTSSGGKTPTAKKTSCTAIKYNDLITLKTDHGTYLNPKGTSTSTPIRAESTQGQFKLVKAENTAATGNVPIDGNTKLAIKAASFNKFVTAGSGSPDSYLTTFQSNVAGWEKFTVQKWDGATGTLCSGDKIQLKSYHNKWVVAEPSGVVKNDRNDPFGWETFTVTKR